MLLFVGLGNPTPDSENNRHNVGFKIIDSINKKFGLSKQKPKFKGLLTTGNVGNQLPQGWTIKDNLVVGSPPTGRGSGQITVESRRHVF